MAYIQLILISLLSVFGLVSIVEVQSAGDADCLTSSGYCGSVEETLELNLKAWEKPRHATQQEYGAGMHIEYIETDVLVAGVGSAGVSAALAAARNGAKVVAVQSRKVLGGNASSESKLHMVGADLQGGRGSYLKTEARESGIVEEYMLDNCVSNPQRCAEMFDLSLYNLFKLEPNINLILNTDVISAEKNENNEITQVIAECQSTQIRYIIKAKVFIDSTGDGRLGAEAYVPFIIGREGKHVYNESLAINQTDNETEGSSFAFTSIDMGHPIPFTAPIWARTFTEQDFKYRGISDNSLDYGYWWVEISYPYNNIRDNNIIQDLLLQNILGIWDYIKNSGKYPNAVNRVLNWFEWWPCKRQGRRFIGQYVQTQNDVLPIAGQTTFEPILYWDRVAYAGWNLDLHNPMGIYDTQHPPNHATPLPWMYSTPLSSLIASNVTNLFLAGRLASFSQVMYGSQRVMKTTSTHGQAVGVAAAYCIKNNILPIQLTNKNINKSVNDVWSIQQQLIRDDAYIIGIFNQDNRDHAKKASNISASSVYINQTEGWNGNPWNIISGQTRAVGGAKGVYNNNKNGYIAGINRWMSNGINSKSQQPEWIILEWNYTISNLSSIEIIFDTGLHRTLMLSQKQSDQHNQKWGIPQPETVKNYSLQVRDISNLNVWIPIQSIDNNYQRRRVHNVSVKTNGLNINGLKVNVYETNGDPYVRICEIRVYDNVKYGDQSFPTKI
eukprot:282168_1